MPKQLGKGGKPIQQKNKAAEQAAAANAETLKKVFWYAYRVRALDYDKTNNQWIANLGSITAVVGSIFTKDNKKIILDDLKVGSYAVITEIESISRTREVSQGYMGASGAFSWSETVPVKYTLIKGVIAADKVSDYEGVEFKD